MTISKNSLIKLSLYYRRKIKVGRIIQKKQRNTSQNHLETNHMFKYRTYIDDKGEETEFTIFLIHGHSEEWHKVERYIKEKLEFNVKVLKEDFSGKIVLNKLKETIWYECDCA